MYIKIAVCLHAI